MKQFLRHNVSHCSIEWESPSLIRTMLFRTITAKDEDHPTGTSMSLLDYPASTSPLLAFQDWVRQGVPGMGKRLWLRSVSGRRVTLGVLGWGSHLRVFLSERELTVAVYWRRQCWDFLLTQDVACEPNHDGVHCSMCDDKTTVRSFATEAELWRDHLFEPFGQWWEQDLLPARELRLERHGSSTWAEFALSNIP